MQASNRPKGGSWRVAVCALARNDVVLFGAAITLNYNFPSYLFRSTLQATKPRSFFPSTVATK